MALRSLSSASDIKADIQRRLALINKAILTQLIVLGEKAVNMSRDSFNINPSAFPVNVNGKTGKPLKQRIRTDGGIDPVFGDYLDHTEVLRSSIGYMVTQNGEAHKADFKSNSAQSFAEEIAAKYGDGWALIVVAGADYALAVESKGYNVISSAEHMVENEMPYLINKLKTSIAKMK